MDLMFDLSYSVLLATRAQQGNREEGKDIFLHSLKWVLQDSFYLLEGTSDPLSVPLRFYSMDKLTKPGYMIMGRQQVANSK